ncbi:hypothetical protein [Stenotrophomonas chelatiphaga]|jgi:hypothetical protein|uniref:hypothetical protein n=1 Tax=Stenotrophomonas chelatiphaga TaxID=517011 RepID=UPI0009FB3FC2
MAFIPALFVLTSLAVTSFLPNVAVAGAPAPITVQPAAPVATYHLHYRKLYDAKPFPNATLTHYANGVYRITSEGEDHYGVFVAQGNVGDQSSTIRYVSLPSPDWGNRTAYHQLTFITGNAEGSGLFVQNAITDTGEAIAQQNGTFSLTIPKGAP